MNKLLSPGSIPVRNTYPTTKQEAPSIEYVQYQAGQTAEYTLVFTEIILITEGLFNLSYDHILNRKVTAGKIILLPPGSHYTIRTDNYASAFIFRFHEDIRFCTAYSDATMLPNENGVSDGMNYLDIKAPIETFFLFLRENMQSGLCQEEYLKLKAEEFLFLLRAYYTVEDLSAFFLPLISSNARFHQFVLRHYRKIKTVREFADLSNCSVSNFDKKFRQAFGISAHQWMQQRRVNLLYHEINATQKPLREIAREQNFLSLPQFNDYCKKHFGYPPGKMRKLASMFRAERESVVE